MMERLQKVLARAGIAARRKAEELILAGRVRVDGRVVTELGTKADSKRQRIEVDGKRIVPEPFFYVLMNKPRDVMCTALDPEGRPTVASLIKDIAARLVPVGRLDYATSGVLLLSNDGDFAMGLLHPKRKVVKIYLVKVPGELGETAVARLREPIVIDGKPTQPIEARIARVENRKTWLELTLAEGKNRQIRRICEAAGFPVMRLVRTRFAGLSVEDLRPGEYRQLTLSELRDLQQQFGVPHRIRPPESTSKVTSNRARSRVQNRRASAIRSDGSRTRVTQRGLTAKGSETSSGSDQSSRKKPAARTKAWAPRTDSPAAGSMPRSKTTKSGTKAGSARTRHSPSGELAVTTPSRRSRRSGSG